MKKNNFKKYKFYTITIDEFFEEYFNFPKETFISLTHKDVKYHIPYVKRCKNSDIKEGDILANNIILVKDKNGYILGYINPLVYMDYDSYTEMLETNSLVLQENIKKEEPENKEEEIDLDLLSLYELRKLLSDYKKTNDNKMIRLISKYIYFKKESHDNRKQKTKKSRIRQIEKDEII